MTFESGLTFFIAIFIFGITPGPGIFAILSRSIAFDAKSCIPLALGMSISDVMYLVMACFGLATIAENWGTAFTAIRLAGAVYLIYLGWRIWTSPVNTGIQTDEQKRGHWLGLFFQGLLISASNPKVIIFYIAFLPTFLDITALQTRDIVIASILTFCAIMAGLLLIIYGSARAKRTLRSTKAMKRLNRLAGSLMASAGVFLATRQ